MTTKITFLRSIILFITICISTSIYALTFSTTKTDVYCNGDKTGSITVSVEDAVGTCYYSLTPNFDPQQINNNTFENLEADTYTVYVKDDNGIIVGPSTVSILEPSKLEITDISTTSSVCKDGKIAIEVAGGSAPYYYSLDGFATQQPSKTFDSLAEGEYTVYVKDKNGCVTSTAANSVKVNPLTVNPLTQKPAANVVCKEDKTASVTFTVVGRTDTIARADTASYYRVELFDITNQHEVIAPDLKFTNKFHPVLTKNRVEKEPVLDANGDPTFDDEGNLITKNVTYKDTLWTEGCHEPTKVQEVLEMSNISYTEDLKGFDCNDKISVSSLGAGAYKIRFYRGSCQIGEEMTFTVGITGSLPSVQINNVGSFCDESEYTIIPTIISTPIVKQYKWTLDDVVIREGQTKNAQEVADYINLKRIFTLDDNNKALKLEIKNQCGSSISNIVKTKVNKRPTALIEANTDICRNPQSEVFISFAGKAPFTYMLQDSTVKTTSDVFIKEAINPSSDVTFTLLSLKDLNCESIAEKDINTLEVKQPDVLTVKPLDSTPANVVVCETDKTASVSFTVLGRTETVATTDIATYYTVKLFDIDNQQEITAPDIEIINKLHPITTVSDNDSITISGLGAGTYKISFYKGSCQFGEEVTFSIGITGSLPIAQINNIEGFCDGSQYTIIPTILSENPTISEYKWTLDDVEIQTGTDKDLTRIFTLDDNNKVLKLSVTNGCGTTTSNSVLVKVNKRPTAIIDSNTDLCRNPQSEVYISFAGKAPITYVLQDNTEKTTSDVFVKEAISPDSDATFTLLSLKDQNCKSIAEDINTLEIKQPDVLSIEPLASKPAAKVACAADKSASVTFTVVGRAGIVTDTVTYYTAKLFDINNQQEITEPDIKITNKFHPVITENRVEQVPVLDADGNPLLNDLGEVVTQEVTYKDTLWTEGCHEPTKIAELVNYDETMFGFDCNDKITVSGLGAGAYSISFYKGECKIAEPITFMVEVSDIIPSVYINEVGSFCNETEITIIPTIEPILSTSKYEWTLDDVVISENKDLTRAFTLDDNNKSLKLTVINTCGTIVSNSVLVQVNPRPTALLETSKGYLCKNQPTDVSITLTGAGPFIYTLPDGTEKTVTDVYLKEEVYPIKDTIFTLVALKDQNCTAIIDKDVNTVETKIYPEPAYDMTINVPEPMVSGRYVKVDATEGFAAYTLYINEDEIPAKGPENTFWSKKFPAGQSTNDFKMILTDNNGCQWTLEYTKVIETTIFPNIFTPNNDGVNDIFLADYDLKVYDRQGTLMYEGNSGWDGTHNGVEANPGVYLYTLFIPTEDGNLEVIKSTLTLER